MTDVLLVGDDKLGRRLLARLGNKIGVGMTLDSFTISCKIGKWKNIE